MAPEQIDPATLHGYYSGALEYSSLVAGAIAGNRSTPGHSRDARTTRQGHHPRHQDGSSPVRERPVRQVNRTTPTNWSYLDIGDSRWDPGGTRHIAHPQFRLKHWNHPAEIAKFMTTKRSKRVILHAICQFVTKMPCHVVSAIVPVTFLGMRFGCRVCATVICSRYQCHEPGSPRNRETARPRKRSLCPRKGRPRSGRCRLHQDGRSLWDCESQESARTGCTSARHG